MTTKNKNLKKIAVCLAFAVTAVAAAGVGSAPKAEAKIVKKQADITKVQKKITGVKDKKYCYYLSYGGQSNPKLVRTDGKKTKTFKKNVRDFWISGKYICYRLWNVGDGCIYRMKKNGTGNRKIARNVWEIVKVQDGYISYGEKSNLYDMVYDMAGAKCYLYDENLSKKLIWDIAGSGVTLRGQFHYLSKEKNYYVIDSVNDQSNDGIYIFNKKGKFIRKIDTGKADEDGFYFYTIKNNMLYASIFNMEKGRYDFEIYKLK